VNDTRNLDDYHSDYSRGRGSQMKFRKKPVIIEAEKEK
jgi:hypothetical protein